MKKRQVQEWGQGVRNSGYGWSFCTVPGRGDVSPDVVTEEELPGGREAP